MYRLTAVRITVMPLRIGGSFGCVEVFCTGADVIQGHFTQQIDLDPGMETLNSNQAQQFVDSRNSAEMGDVAGAATTKRCLRHYALALLAQL